MMEESGGIYCTPPTSDGIQLRIKRYCKNGEEKNTFPVILCHGVLANKHSLDFGEEGSDLWKKYSLAAFLYDKSNDEINFDIWVPELRGRRSLSESGECEKPPVPKKYNWCIDDYIEKDIPAIIEYVKTKYKDYSTRIFWIGMSMGGMLGYAYGEKGEGFQNLAGVVTIASPVAFEYSKSFLFEKGSRFFPRKMSFMFNLKELLERFPKAKEEFIENGANPDNVKPEVVEKYIELGFDNYLSSKIINQFALFYRHKDFCHYPRCPWMYDLFGKIPLLRKCFSPPSYKKNLHKFKTPLLAIAGGADREAPPAEVKYAISHVGSKDVTYAEFSEDSPFTHIDYAHLDFHLGNRANEEVYPLIYDWLVEQIYRQKMLH